MSIPSDPRSKRESFEKTVSGAQNAPLLPHLRSDLPTPPAPSKQQQQQRQPPQLEPQQVAHTLEEFRRLEGREKRKARLREIWNQWPQRKHRQWGSASDPDLRDGPQKALPSTGTSSLTPEAAEKLSAMYENELLGSCGASSPASDPHPIGWKPFVAYAKAKEAGTRFITVVIVTSSFFIQSSGRYSTTNSISMGTVILMPTNSLKLSRRLVSKAFPSLIQGMNLSSTLHLQASTCRRRRWTSSWRTSPPHHNPSPLRLANLEIFSCSYRGRYPQPRFTDTTKCGSIWAMTAGVPAV